MKGLTSARVPWRFVLGTMLIALVALLVWWIGASGDRDRQGNESVVGTARGLEPGDPTGTGVGSTVLENEREFRRSPEKPVALDSHVAIATLRAAHPVEIVVEDDASNPLAGARIESLSDAGTEPVQWSDAQGRCALASLDRRELHITATLPEYAARELHFPYGAPERVRIVLKGQTVLRGRVLRESGNAVGTKVRVLVLPSNAVQSLEFAAARLVAGIDSGFSTTTDEEGRFEIRGLTRDATYQLVAGGAGFIMDEPLSGLRPGEKPVEARVTPGYACALRWVDEHGVPLARGGVSARGGASHPPNSTSHLASNALPSAILAGLAPELADRRSGIPQLFVDPSGPARIGPVQLHWDVPGYRPLDSEAYLESISTGGNLVTLRFEQEASAFGVVRVHVRGAAVPVDANLLRSREVFEGHTVSCARLLLESQGGEAHEYSLFPDGAGTWTNTHVPHGTYKARIGAWNSPFLYPSAARPPLSVQVTAEPLDVHLDLSTTGAIELRLQSKDGSSFVGHVLLSLTRVDTNTSQMVRFERPPFLWPFLEPGEYRIWAVLPSLFRGSSGSRADVVTISGGQHVIVEQTESDD